MHIHLFEFTDQSWCPQMIRQYITDYLHFVIKKAGIYKPAVPLLQKVIDKTGIDEIIDLGSGSGGGVDIVQNELSDLYGRVINVTLSDKYPNAQLYETMKDNSNGGLKYIKESIDAAHVPKHLGGIRTMFSAFHHFNPGQAKAIIKDAVDNKTPICIFEGAGKTMLDFMGILLFTPIVFLLVTPFIRPFRLSRLIFTYIIPAVPIGATWDGLVSVLRMHTPDDMLEMANSINAGNYEWKAEQIRGKFGNRMMYLTGYPVK